MAKLVKISLQDGDSVPPNDPKSLCAARLGTRFPLVLVPENFVYLSQFPLIILVHRVTARADFLYIYIYTLLVDLAANAAVNFYQSRFILTSLQVS